ncbi:hypothetical protein PHMEG_0002737 [Phytophthora megakarya]|uniref:RNase H type-1 domain-containing protein n=1 Tax=Phytophthora megakarya TaxID=4795 RepID=A0A225WXS3_9STRA|nr:hypothetical protein PHMEG_0002737 [Phytophthora megakarya]
MVLSMLQRRKQPKAKRLLHWYRLTRRLADLCEVQSWTHHYRQHNKMAEWLANYAMDNRASAEVNWLQIAEGNRLEDGVLSRMDDDCKQWVTLGRKMEELKGAVSEDD